MEGDATKAEGWMEAVGNCDAVVNLAGENIFGGRWTTEFKARLLESRVHSTRNVMQALVHKPTSTDGRPKVLVNASAIGYYGPRGDEELGEDGSPGNDYLAKICIDWEKEAHAADGKGVRVALIRIGVVLAKEGGALPKMLTPFKLFAGGPVGSGRQWMSWIHIEDLVGILVLALDQPNATGPINGTAPHPVTNRDFATALGEVLHRPSFFPTPAFALRLALGEVANVVTTGQRVLPRRALQLGYKFQFPELAGALTNLLG